MKEHETRKTPVIQQGRAVDPAPGEASPVADLSGDLDAVLGSASLKLLVLVRIFFRVLFSFNPVRIFRFFKALLAYFFGRRNAMTRFIVQDPIYLNLVSIKSRLESLSPASTEIDTGPGPGAGPQEHLPQDAAVKAGPVSLGRVAYLTNQLLDVNERRPRYGGGERYCLTLTGLLRDLGFTVDVYQLGYKRFEDDYHGIRVKAIEYGNEYFSEFNLGATDEFYRISLDYDHAIYNLPELSAGKMRSDALAVCHGIWFDHNNYGRSVKFRSPEWYRYLRRAFDNPALTVSVDTNSINVIRSLWPELALRMRYIPNFVDTDLFAAPDPPRSNTPVRVLFPRRSQVNRGSRILGDILKRIPHDAAVTWLGEGDPVDVQIIRSLCERDKRLTFDSASFDEMPARYRDADICVISTLACEGTSFSCLEALASGCAVVSTNAGGLPDLVQDGYNGLLVDPFPEAIAEAVNRLITDHGERTRLQRAARASAKSFCITKWRERWTSVLKSAAWL